MTYDKETYKEIHDRLDNLNAEKGSEDRQCLFCDSSTHNSQGRND